MPFVESLVIIMRRRFILTLIVFVCIASTGSLLYAAQEPADNPALVVSIDDDSLEIYIAQSERCFAEFNSIKLQSSKDNTGIIAVEEKFEFFPDALEGATCFRFHYESNGILGDLCENSNNKHFKEVEASDFFWGSL